MKKYAESPIFPPVLSNMVEKKGGEVKRTNKRKIKKTK